jgi:hypothetical protein
MAQRSFEQRNIHDRVIEVAVENAIRTNNWTVYSNPGTAKNTRIGNLYPDIILTPLDYNDIILSQYLFYIVKLQL